MRGRRAREAPGVLRRGLWRYRRRKLREAVMWMLVGAVALGAGLYLAGQWELSKPSFPEIKLSPPDVGDWIRPAAGIRKPTCEDIKEREKRMSYDYVWHGKAPSYEASKKLDEDLARYC